MRKPLRAVFLIVALVALGIAGPIAYRLDPPEFKLVNAGSTSSLQPYAIDVQVRNNHFRELTIENFNASFEFGGREVTSVEPARDVRIGPFGEEVITAHAAVSPSALANPLNGARDLSFRVHVGFLANGELVRLFREGDLGYRRP